MLFNSFEYLIFLIIVFALYWLLHNSKKKQNLILLISSYVFYGWWDWRFLSLIIFSSFIDYGLGLKISHTTFQSQKKKWLLLSLTTNLGLLGVFKYYNFFIKSFSDLAQNFNWTPNDLTLNIILPVGISFYTFQTLSYTIDIYRGTLKPTKSIVSFFTYVAMFPQLVAGPIERASNLLSQIESKRTFKKSWFNEGIIQIAVGLFRKIVIADTLGIYVDSVYVNPEIHNSSTLILATLFYAFQIYYDFSGYSDIAIGTAKLFGFEFKQNFNLPYFSRSITEFWRKWHISLSNWLRDYLYIPLGGNRRGVKLTYRNLMITMLLGGLWHGSSWNFIIWGGIHGISLSVEKFLRSKNNYFFKKLVFFERLITLTIILFAWIFFRSPDLSSAYIFIKRIFMIDFSIPFIGNIHVLINSIIVLTTGILFDFYLYKNKIHLENFGAKFNMVKMVTVITIIIMLITLFYSSSNNFIYFQF